VIENRKVLWFEQQKTKIAKRQRVEVEKDRATVNNDIDGNENGKEK
jgi:hypothetical protein